MNTYTNREAMARFYAARLAGLSMEVAGDIARTSPRTAYRWNELSVSLLLLQDNELLDLIDIEYRKVLDAIALYDMFIWGFLNKPWSL